MTEFVWLIVLFLIVTSLAFVATQWSNTRTERIKRRLNHKKDDNFDSDDDEDLVFGSLTKALGGSYTEAGREALTKDLREAGYYRRSALLEFSAVRFVLVFFPLVVAGLVSLLVDQTYMLRAILVGLIVSVLGFSVPRVYLNYRGRRRTAEIERGLPVAVDLLTLAISGGQSLFSGLQRVSQELRSSFPALARELQIVQQQAELSSLNYALRQFADRVEVPEVQNLTLILTQSDRLGTDTATALLEFSTNYRMNLRQRAEAQANRASFWMLFPSVLCLWVAAVILLVGPVYFDFANRRREVRDMIRGFNSDIGESTGDPAEGSTQQP